MPYAGYNENTDMVYVIGVIPYRDRQKRLLHYNVVGRWGKFSKGCFESHILEERFDRWQAWVAALNRFKQKLKQEYTNLTPGLGLDRKWTSDMEDPPNDRFFTDLGESSSRILSEHLKVECVDDTNSDLEQGMVYDAMSHHDEEMLWVYVDGNKTERLFDRFKIVERG